MNTIKDLVGNDVRVGDAVAYCMAGYSALRTGRVSKITPSGVSVWLGNPRHSTVGTVNRQQGQFILIPVKE